MSGPTQPRLYAMKFDSGKIVCELVIHEGKAGGRWGQEINFK